MIRRNGALLVLIITIVALSGCGGGSRRPVSSVPVRDTESDEVKAREAMQAGLFEDAVVIIENILRADPYNRKARQDLGRALVQGAISTRKGLDLAVDYLGRAEALELEIQGFSDAVRDIYPSAAKEAENAGEMEKAVQIMVEATGAIPGDRELLAEKARLSGLANLRDVETEARTRLYELQAGGEANLSRLIELHRESGNMDRMEYYLQAAVEAYPEDPGFSGLARKAGAREAERLMNEGIAYFEARDLRNAINAVEDARKIAPARVSLEAMKVLVFSYEELGMIESADRIVDEILFREPDDDSADREPFSADFMLVAGRVKLLSGDAGKALELLKKARESNPDDSQVYFAEAAVLERLGRVQEAVARLDEVLHAQPNNTEALERKGFLFFRQRAFDRAVDVWRSVLEYEPDSGDMHFNIGAAMAAQRRWVAAINSYREAIRLEPENVRYYYYLFVALKEARDFDAMETAKRRILELDRYGEYGRKISQIFDLSTESTPGTASLGESDAELYRLALEHARAARFDDAISLFRTIVDRSPAHTDALLNLGNVYMAKGDEPRAIALYVRARNVRKDIPAVHQFLGHAYVQLGLPAEARSSYEQSLEIERNNIEIQARLSEISAAEVPEDEHRLRKYLDIAAALIAEKVHDEAFVMVSRARKIEPESYRADIVEARLFESENMTSRAESLYRQALKSKPDSVEAMQALAFFLSRTGKSSEAVRLLQDIVRRNPSNVNAGLELCRLHRVGGDIDKAMAVLESLEPDTPADYARIRSEQERFRDN